jgi:hypothetical protein
LIDRPTRHRAEVRVRLAERPDLSRNAWYQTYWEQLEIREQVALAVAEFIGSEAGIDALKLIPTDRLVEDLRLPDLCWPDWDMRLAFLLRDTSGKAGFPRERVVLNTVGEAATFLETVEWKPCPPDEQPLDRA